MTGPRPLSFVRAMLLALVLLVGAALGVAADPAGALQPEPQPGDPCAPDDATPADVDPGAAEEAAAEERDEDDDDDEEQHVYAIGETAHTSEFDVTVHCVVDPWVSTNEFDTPLDPANRFVAVEVTVKNTSDDPEGFSSWNTELIDGEDRHWDVAFAGYELPSVDAVTVAPGEERRGWMVFEVPPDATDFTIRIKGSITATGSLFEL